MFDLSELKKLRKSLNLTQKDISRQAGVSQSLIAKVESGRIDPAYSKAKKIMDTLNNLPNSQQNAKDLINKSIISVAPSDTMKKAITKMRKYNISQMPVIEDKKAVGLVSEAIILEALMNKSSHDDCIKTIMKDAPPVLSEDVSLSVVTHLLKEYPMILISKNGKLNGHITKADILNKAFR